ncbi:MAG: zinc ribbon domain-containing protein [candidate division Zixibacteria bacterium]
MPTYEFNCGSCGNVFEKFLPITSGSAYDCPNCGSSAKKKISGGIGLIFKGAGFYINDYKKPEAAEAEKVNS